MLRRYFIYGNLGIFMEVFWTGMQSFIKRGDICLTGTTSVIMFFIYGLVANFVGVIASLLICKALWG